MNSINGKNTLPDGWVETTIGDVFDFQYGKSLPRKKRNPDGNYPVYGANGVGRDNYLVKMDRAVHSINEVLTP